MTWTTRPRSDRGGLAVIEVGQGPSVVLLHGVGLRAEAWGEQLSGLSGKARIFAPDMPGHGESTMPTPAMDLDGYVDAAEAVLRALDLPVALVGHSMGAMIALDLARRMPEHVRGVAALNAVFERTDEAAAAVKARAARLDGQTPTDPSATLERWFGAVPSPERDACHDWLTQIDPAAYKSAYTAFAHCQTPDRAGLAALECPALFMTGALEPNSTPEMSHAMARLAPRGRAHIVEGAAHMMPMTHPMEVNAELMRFVEETCA